MNIAIVGSRLRTEAQPDVEALVASLSEGSTVVSGHCEGIDLWAEQAAAARGLRVVSCAPNIRPGMTYLQRVEEYYGRNQEIVDHADVLYAFVMPGWTDERQKGGTNYTIRCARKKGIPVHIMAQRVKEGAEA